MLAEVPLLILWHDAKKTVRDSSVLPSYGQSVQVVRRYPLPAYGHSKSNKLGRRWLVWSDPGYCSNSCSLVSMTNCKLRLNSSHSLREFTSICVGRKELLRRCLCSIRSCTVLSPF